MEEDNEIDLDNYCHEPSLPRSEVKVSDGKVTEDWDTLNKLFV